MNTLLGASEAALNNAALVEKIEKRAAKADAVLGPCLRSYRARLDDQGDARHPLANLTEHLVGTYEETEASIRSRMEAKHAGKPDADSLVESSVRNSLMRTAGTNYQSLVSYAIARFLATQESPWYLADPIPAELKHELSIEFTAGVVEESNLADGDDGEEEAASGVVVKPDIDVMIRNSAWDPDSEGREPMMILSSKTSLADRAGSAARWKTYFDLVTNPCAHACEDSCAYGRLGMRLAFDPNVELVHGIVTANIYKINSDEYFAQYGELASNQAKANTFMFDYRYTTRDDSDDVMHPGWESLVKLPDALKELSDRHELPY